MLTEVDILEVAMVVEAELGTEELAGLILAVEELVEATGEESMGEEEVVEATEEEEEVVEATGEEEEEVVEATGEVKH